MTHWAVTTSAALILLTGIVPSGQQPATAAPQQQTPPATAPPAQPPPSKPPAPTGRGRGGIEAEIAAGADFSPKPPVTRLDPKEQQKRFLLPPGFKIEPVLTDPLIQDPVGVTFDANGRMYVLEMRSYMRDAEGTNSREPISRISRHEDTNGDGTFDKHTVFADNMVMPRMAFPLQDGVILTLETDNRDMYKLTDTNGDGVSDKRELFYPNVGRVTNMEWQPGGLTWALDNWLYMTYNPFRLRIAPDGKILREETDPNGGQWWSAQDNYGKMWWVDGGGEMGPVNFQTPIVYGAFNVPDNFEPDFRVPWPAAGGIADMQGGMRRVRMPDGTLNHFTATSGVEIYRGHRLPADLVGDLFFTEPVGRIVRRAKVVVTEGLTQLRNAHPKSEFIQSTDPLFRPVAIMNGPDGTLYLMDMYTGIIQDAQFVGPYLRRKVEQFALDKQHNLGRIWRITYEGTPPDRRRPRMYSETAAQLVKHLEHQSGWWRDTAQQQLVLRQDKSVVPALKTMATSSSNHLARIHAIWTLEGLGALEAALVRDQMKDKDPKIRIQAIRASETLYKAGDKSFADDYRAMIKDSDTDVVIQAMLTLNLHRVPQYADAIRAARETNPARGIREIGDQLLKPRGGSQGQPASLADNAVAGLNLSADDRRVLRRGEATYKELCFSCHGPDGQGAPMAGAPEGTTLAPPLGASPRVTGHRDYPIKILLHGLTGDIDGKSYPGGIMVPMGTNTDEWIADITSYIRNNFGNGESFVRPDHVATVRAATSSRKEPWTLTELAETTPTLLTNQGEWKATASHNSETAGNGLNSTGTTRWDSGAVQEPGMWFQIELPRAINFAEMMIDTFVGGRGGLFGGRGGRGGTIPGLTAVAYKVQVSIDGTTWSDPVAEGQGAGAIAMTTPVTLTKPVQAKFIRITQTGTPTNQFGWGIQRIRVFAIGK
jgi:mono/diheme cytochrome c family protein/glucose/arabinose dehydrogenase